MRSSRSRSIVRSHAAGSVARLLVVLAAAACQPSATPEPSDAEFRTAVAGADWELRELNGSPASLGAGGRPATIRFEADSARVAGFAGCNRYFGGYTLDGMTIRFGAVGMTKMACAEGMPLEQQLAAALEATRRYELAGGRLTLLGESGGAVARFERASR
jgi:heat shock protein HslJ